MNSKSPRRAWNRGQVIGQKHAFTLKEVRQIEEHLLSQENWHDLALLSFGLDTMLRASDLLATQVWQVCYYDGSIRRLIHRRQQKTQQAVYPVLTDSTCIYLKTWLEESRKKPEDFLFTRTKSADALPVSRSHYADIVKNWAELLGHQPENYSSHSIRRTKPSHMYREGEDIALISRLLGHKTIASTIEYLGITQQSAEKAALRHPMMGGRGKSLK